jgi:hypothetical protein
VNKKLLHARVFFIIIFLSSVRYVSGFNPSISYIPPAQYNNKSPVVTVIGFPDQPTMYQQKFDTKKTFTVTFSFYHNLLYRLSLQNPRDYFCAIHAIDLGQQEEAKVLLQVIVECYEKGYKKISIFANSRGAAATITMLDMLSHPHNYMHVWCFLKVNTDQQQEVRNMVARGTIFLAHPLMDQRETINYIATRFTEYFWLLPGKDLIKKLSTYGLFFCMRHLTSYQEQFQTPITILKNNIGFDQWPYRIILASADWDPLVGIKHKISLSELAWKFPKKLTIIPGGKSHMDIKKLLQYFRNYLIAD